MPAIAAPAPIHSASPPSAGLSASAIAARVHLAPGTVRNYLSSAMAKLGAPSRIEAARIAYEEGWI